MPKWLVRLLFEHNELAVHFDVRFVLLCVGRHKLYTITLRKFLLSVFLISCLFQNSSCNLKKSSIVIDRNMDEDMEDDLNDDVDEFSEMDQIFAEYVTNNHLDIAWKVT